MIIEKKLLGRDDVKCGRYFLTFQRNMLTRLQGRTGSEEVPPELIVPHGTSYEKKAFLFK